MGPIVPILIRFFRVNQNILSLLVIDVGTATKLICPFYRPTSVIQGLQLRFQKLLQENRCSHLMGIHQAKSTHALR